MDKEILQLMLGFGFIVIVSVLASKTSSKLGIPILLIFIVIGMLSGSDGPGRIHFIDAGATQILGTIALIFILYSGGLSTDRKLVSPVWRQGVILSSLGVIISTAILAMLIRAITYWDWASSALLAATLSSTDAAAVFGILKTKNLGLKKNLQALLELESGSNDPMAVFLTLSLIHLIKTPESFSWFELFQSFFIQMSLGGLAGWFLGQAMVKLINWLNLEFEGLYPVLSLAGVVSIYAFAEYFGGNGFLSVYVAGLAMSGEKYFSRQSLGVFHDGLAWLMQVAMFLALGLLVTPSEIHQVLTPGLIIAMGLIFFARPLSVWICLIPFHYSLKETWFLSWGGLRGAVPIILATYFLVESVPGSRVMFNIIFLIVSFSMLVQGCGLGLMAKWMGVQEYQKPHRRLPFKSRHSHSEFIEFFIGSDSQIRDSTIFQLKLPKEVLVVLIHRQGQEFIPKGSTKIEAGDRLVCLSAKECISSVEGIFGSDHFVEQKVQW